MDMRPCASCRSSRLSTLAPAGNCLKQFGCPGPPMRHPGQGPREARTSCMVTTVCPNDQCRMIAVDTSALMAIVPAETAADACIRALEAEPEVLISAGTVAEALIVAARRNVAEEMAKLIDGLGFEVVTV